MIQIETRTLIIALRFSLTELPLRFEYNPDFLQTNMSEVHLIPFLNNSFLQTGQNKFGRMIQIKEWHDDDRWMRIKYKKNKHEAEDLLMLFAKL